MFNYLPSRLMTRMTTIASVKSDTVELTGDTIGIHVNTGGNFNFKLKNDSDFHTIVVVAGRTYELPNIKAIHSTNTTATGIIYYR